jgi:thiamine pyrophosphokinase
LFEKRIVIFANGELPNIEKARALLHAGDFIIAADGGTRHAFALGQMPNIVIGDLDSITKEERGKVEEVGAEIIQHPQDKNETDLELAIQHALSLNPEQIIILAALGGRLDQTLGNIALLNSLQSFDRLSTTPSKCNMQLDDGIEEVFFCRDKCAIHGTNRDIVSLIPWQGEVTGIVTTGLKWPLQNETLYPQKTRGISNEMLNDEATVQISSGLLLVVHRRID